MLVDGELGANIVQRPYPRRPVEDLSHGVRTEETVGNAVLGPQAGAHGETGSVCCGIDGKLEFLLDGN